MRFLFCMKCGEAMNDWSIVVDNGASHFMEVQYVCPRCSAGLTAHIPRSIECNRSKRAAGLSCRAVSP